MIINFMVGELYWKIMVVNPLFMKEIFNMDRKMVKENINMEINTIITEIGLMIWKMEKGFIIMINKDFIMVNGSKIKDMVKEV